MVAQQVGPVWTVEHYIELERNSSVKHEFHSGYVYAMSGGSQAHSQIAGNVYALLRAGVRGTACRALNSDIKVRQSQNDYVYADAVVTCDRRDVQPGQDWISFPALIVEVLSPSTERHDRGDKFDGYSNIPTFREYVIVDSRKIVVEVRRRDDAGLWTSATFGPGDTVTLASIALTMSMNEIYEDSGL
jgi:Uma2 family endonuclease